MSTKTFNEDDRRRAGNGQFKELHRQESPVELVKPNIDLGEYTSTEELFGGELGHHLSPLIGRARSSANEGERSPELDDQLAERIQRAALSISDVMAEDRRQWVAGIIKTRLDPILKSIQARKKGEDSTPDAELFQTEVTELTAIFEREKDSTGPLPASGLPILGSADAGYEDRLDDDGNLVLQIRFENRKPNDAPDGTAAIIKYSRYSTHEKFYSDGKLHDGSGDKPSERTATIAGKVTVERGFIRSHRGYAVPQDSPDGQPAKVVHHSRFEKTPWNTRLAGDVETEWRTDGKMQDPETGKPAWVISSTDGSVKLLHAPYGRIQDLDDGTPAERHYGPEGQLTLETRRFDDHLWDSDDGEPAYRRWSVGGELLETLHYIRSDKRTGPSTGVIRRAVNYWAPTEPRARYEG